MGTSRSHCFPLGLTACSVDRRVPEDLKEPMRAGYLHSDTETSTVCFSVLVFAQVLKTYWNEEPLGSQHLRPQHRMEVTVLFMLWTSLKQGNTQKQKHCFHLLMVSLQDKWSSYLEQQMLRKPPCFKVSNCVATSMISRYISQKILFN